MLRKEENRPKEWVNVRLAIGKWWERLRGNELGSQMVALFWTDLGIPGMDVSTRWTGLSDGITLAIEFFFEW